MKGLCLFAVLCGTSLAGLTIPELDGELDLDEGGLEEEIPQCQFENCDDPIPDTKGADQVARDFVYHTVAEANDIEDCQADLTLMANQEVDSECTCEFIGVDTNTNVQYICQTDNNVCYNLVSGWCAPEEQVCEVP